MEDSPNSALIIYAIGAKDRNTVDSHYSDSVFASSPTRKKLLVIPKSVLFVLLQSFVDVCELEKNFNCTFPAEVRQDDTFCVRQDDTALIL